MAKIFISLSIFCQSDVEALASKRPPSYATELALSIESYKTSHTLAKAIYWIKPSCFVLFSVCLLVSLFVCLFFFFDNFEIFPFSCTLPQFDTHSPTFLSTSSASVTVVSSLHMHSVKKISD